MSQVIIIASFKPKEGQEAAVHQVLSVMVTNTRAEPGNLVYNLYRDKDGTGFTLFESYTDQDAVDLHRAADYFKNYRATIMDLLAEPIAVKSLVGVDVVGG